MQNNYLVLNLTNGLTLVGDVEWSATTAYVSFPLEVSANPITNDDGKIIGEHMLLKPYLVMTDELSVAIDEYNIITTYPLANRLVESYENMVDNVYGSNVQYDGSFINKDQDTDEIIDEIKEMTPEQAKETKDRVDQLLDALEMSGRKNPDDTIH